MGTDQPAGMGGLRQVVLEELGRLAPDLDPDRVDPDGLLSEELDIDSLSFLLFVTALSDRTGVVIPERDYPLVATINSCVTYLGRRRRHDQGRRS